MKYIELKHSSSDGTVLKVKYCDTFFSKLAGLMFTKELPQDQGILLVEDSESRVNTAIHMLFMNYDITVLWLDKNKHIVDKALAKRWRPMYMPKKPAQYVVELHRDHYDDYAIGERMTWDK